jgi:xylulose-5-phosphate/fructose-6-phosphate phosphoketolase
MPKEIIDQPHPPPLKSSLPDYISQLSVQLKPTELPEDVKNGLVAFRRAACYIAAGEFTP